ncbi:MAG: 50S ribosomal protein L11 methyltransferase [Alphaproteobacteria bacterium]
MTGDGSATGDIWQIDIDLPDNFAVAPVEAALEDIATGLSSFEIIGTPGWRITAYTAGEPDRADVLARLAVAAAAADIAMPDIDVSRVTEKDWVAEVERALAPIHVGPYYVFGSHVTDPPPDGSIAIRIDAGQAFGTGNHETTRGCLQAIETLCAERAPSNPLDVGTGSGILAIALAKRLGGRVTASDNDPIAVDVATENAGLNGVGDLICFHRAEGLDLPALQAGAPYDLVVANIVANPLIGLSADIAGALAEDGRVVLSGILLDQAEDVAAAYVANGLTLIERIEIGDWATLTLGANSRSGPKN